MKSTTCVYLITLALALATGAMGYLGVMDWDGESGGNVALALPGLPLVVCVIALTGVGIHPVIAIAVGVVAQFLCCLIPLGVVRLIVRAVRGDGGRA
jgi:hypothetical protein